MDSCLTYDQEALYFYGYGQTDGEACITRLLRKDWSYEILAQGESLTETKNYRVNQVDREYFYYGVEMLELL